MSVQVSTTGVTNDYKRTEYPLRFGTGIPIITMGSNSVGQRFALKGNSTSPTSFTTTIFSQTGIPGDQYNSNWVMLSSTQLGFLWYLSGMTTTLQLYKVLEDGSNSNETVASYSSLPISNNTQFDIAVDGNGNWHVIFTDDVSNMGSNYTTLKYTNNIGGSWKSPVTIEGAPNQISINSFTDIGIQIDINNIPFVYYQTSNGRYWAIGDVVNATTFTIDLISAFSATYSGKFIFSDEDGDHFVCRLFNTDLIITHHNTGDAWATNSETTISNVEFNYLYGIKVIGNSAFIIHKDTTNNTSGVSITELDISGANPTYVGTTHNTDENWHTWGSTMKATPVNHNYDASGTDHGVGPNATDFDLCFNFNDDGNADYEPYWRNYSLVTPTTGTLINIGNVWKEITGIQINIGGTWKTAVSASINIGDSWKSINL